MFKIICKVQKLIYACYVGVNCKVGKTTNHCVVMAMLYSGGVNHGLHPFVVQTRDMTTHEPLSGITDYTFISLFTFNVHSGTMFQMLLKYSF